MLTYAAKEQVQALYVDQTLMALTYDSDLNWSNLLVYAEFELEKQDKIPFEIE